MLCGYYLDKGYHSHVKVWGEHGWLQAGGGRGAAAGVVQHQGRQGAEGRAVHLPQGRARLPAVHAGVRARAAGLDDAADHGRGGAARPAEHLRLLRGGEDGPIAIGQNERRGRTVATAACVFCNATACPAARRRTSWNQSCHTGTLEVRAWPVEGIAFTLPAKPLTRTPPRSRWTGAPAATVPGPAGSS